MESFVLLRKHLAMCGIEISQKPLENHQINVKNSTVFILLCGNITLSALTINEMNTFKEYTDIVFRSVSIGVCGILYEIIVWKTSKLFKFINNLEDTVNTSKYYNLQNPKKNSIDFPYFFVRVRRTGLDNSESQGLYTETSQKVAKWIKIVDIALVKITPTLTILPASIVSFFIYFTTDLGDSAFQLPFPMW